MCRTARTIRKNPPGDNYLPSGIAWDLELGGVRLKSKTAELHLPSAERQAEAEPPICRRNRLARCTEHDESDHRYGAAVSADYSSINRVRLLAAEFCCRDNQ